MRILVCRTDNIGDVILTFPVAGYLKAHMEDCEIGFVGRTYTQPIIESCTDIDFFVNADEFMCNSPWAIARELKSQKVDAILFIYPNLKLALAAKLAGIEIRVGVDRRWFHWLTCNRLVSFSRKGSKLHETQLNLKLLEPIFGEFHVPLAQMNEFIHVDHKSVLPNWLRPKLYEAPKSIIFHPKSYGSAKEWSLLAFQTLANSLCPKKYRLFITGSKKENEYITAHGGLTGDHIVDLSGKLSLDELMAFMPYCNAVVAASTGPLHMAAVLGVKSIGLYTQQKPMHPERWGPIGEDTTVLTEDENSSSHYLDIDPKEVAVLL